MQEGQYKPAMEGVSLDEPTGVAVSRKNLLERRFNRFKRGMDEVTDQGCYNEADFQKIKDTKKTGQIRGHPHISGVSKHRQIKMKDNQGYQGNI